MKNFEWQHIEFINGSNPYICKTEKEFKKMQNKYVLEKISDNCWKATDSISYAVVGFEDKNKMANFYREYQLKPSAIRVIKQLKEKGFESIVLRKEIRYLKNNDNLDISSSSVIATW